MRLLQSASEDDMVAVFLAAEAYSERYGPRIREILVRLGQPSRIIERPDTRDDAANASSPGPDWPAGSRGSGFL
ncbi:MAG TPA: hypothetical protein VF070_12620 [Streptosporangiaceae bacterium]